LTRLGINFNQLAEALKNLTAIGSAIRVHSQNVNDPTQEVLISRRYWDETEDKLMDIISNYHKSNPLKPGISKEEVRSKLAVSIPFFEALVSENIKSQKIDQVGSLLAKHSQQIRFNGEEEEIIKQLFGIMETSKLAPPSRKEIIGITGRDVFEALVNRGDLIEISEGVIFSKPILESMEKNLFEIFEKKNKSPLQNSGIILEQAESLHWLFWNIAMGKE